MSDEKINETINNLKKYVEEDNFYSGEWSVESDFDAFCYNHCLDINRVLSYISELEKLPNKIRDKIKELEENRDKYVEENKFGSYMEAEGMIKGLKEILGE